MQEGRERQAQDRRDEENAERDEIRDVHLSMVIDHEQDEGNGHAQRSN